MNIKAAFIFLVGMSFAIMSQNAYAVFGDPIMTRSSEIATVITEANGFYLYNYTVKNTSNHGLVYDEEELIIRDDTGMALDVWPLIVDYEIPLADYTDIWGIQSPNGWAYEILSDMEYFERYETYNPFGAAYILHWYDDAISWDEGMGYTGIAENPIAPPGYSAVFSGVTCYENSIDGFIFSSLLSPVDGPYLSSWQDAARFVGDPPLPGEAGVGGGTIPYDDSNSPVPEPSTLVLIGLGGILIAIGTGRKS